MNVHDLRLAFAYQLGKLPDKPRVGDGRVKWPLGINIKAAKRLAPAADPMDRDTIVVFSMIPGRTSERGDLNVVTASREFMRKHAHVQVTAAYQRRRIAVRYL
jgi:hypothetical protein